MSDPAPLVVVVGPTAVGKSAVALELARRSRGSILSADAMQIYRGFDRGTAKPSAAERALVPHHLIDIADPGRDFSAGDFVRAADAALRDVRSGGRQPFLVGGTGLYVRAFLLGLFEGPQRSVTLRCRLRAVRERRGLGFLHRMLRRLDAPVAGRIGSADEQRIVRALEVRLLSGRPLSEHLERQGPDGWQGAERLKSVKIGLVRQREELQARIRERVRRFFAAGLVDEVRGLVAAGVPAAANAFKGIGYRQALEVVAGRSGEAEAIESTVRATQRYARRQMTWFRRERNVHWLRVGGNADEAVRAAEALIA